MTRYFPEPLSDHHVLDEFDCGEDLLNAWLKRRARRNEGKYTRTFVCAEDGRVVGFYSLSAGGMARADLVKSMQRNAPELVPVTLLGRFAVDVAYQRRGIGGELLHDALQRALSASFIVGSVAVVIHVKSETVRHYYERFGFQPLLPNEPLTVVLPMASITVSISSD